MSFLSLIQVGLQRIGQLVRAGGRLGAAVDSSDARDDVLRLLAAHQRTDAFEVAIAAADKLHVLDDVSIHLRMMLREQVPRVLYKNAMLISSFYFINFVLSLYQI